LTEIWAGQLGFNSLQRQGYFLFAMSILALWPIQPPIQWVSGALSLGVKQPVCEADHSLLLSPMHLHGMVLGHAQGHYCLHHLMLHNLSSW
jgi:hypothetical protein